MPASREVRLREKETLSNLNDRLAVYIDRVRRLEAENEKLSLRITESESIEKRKRSELGKLYETKLEELQTAAEEAANDMTLAETESRTATVERDNLRAKVEQLVKELGESEDVRLRNETVVEGLRSAMKSLDGENAQLERGNMTLSTQNADLKCEIEQLRKQADDVGAENMVLQNTNGSIREDYESFSRSHNEHLAKERHKREMEIATTAREIERTYESRLREQLQRARVEFDARLRKNREQVEQAHKEEMDKAKEAHCEMNSANEECALLRLRMRKFEQNVIIRENTAEQLKKKVTNLEKQLAFTRSDTEKRLQQRDNFVKELQKESECLQKECQALSELKMQIDTELRAYNCLLHSEESRLDISQQSTPLFDVHGGGAREDGEALTSTLMISGSQQDEYLRRGVKRKHLVDSGGCAVVFDNSKTYKTTADSKCAIDIEPHDTNGQFIRLVSKGAETLFIGQWSIKSLAGEKETVYRFHNRQTIDPGQMITIWNAESGQRSAPPSELVMRSEQWPCGDYIRTVLIDVEGREMAVRESVATGLLCNSTFKSNIHQKEH
ncbi:Lamin-1 [Toxocara canis]|uniref:Lamin-1 n=1 Tax=Toxocara canis TaxID=6265 RepID=A0A0B2W608_TOXCA|nr:Lamin-1 [Toxocara canis]